MASGVEVAVLETGDPLDVFGAMKLVMCWRTVKPQKRPGTIQRNNWVHVTKGLRQPHTIFRVYLLPVYCNRWWVH